MVASNPPQKEPDELFHEKENNSIASVDTEDEYLIIFYYNNIKYLDGIEGEKRRELFYNFYNNLGRPWFQTLMDYLIEHKAIMWKTFYQVNPGYKQINFYNGLTILKPFIKKVKISNPDIISQGNQPKISMWKWASPEDFHKEQARYARLLLEEKEAEREFIRLKQQRAVARVERQQREEAQAREARAARVRDLASQVLNMLPRPLTTQSSPIYKVMDGLGLGRNDPIRKDITETVLRRIQGGRGLT